MRFDYSGSGNSQGELEDISPAAWVDDLESALHYLVELSACQEISVVTIRFAAHIAARATKRLGLSRFVAWDPLYAGQSWADELICSQRKTPGRIRRNIDRNREYQGRRVKPGFLDEIIELGSVKPQADHVVHVLSESYEHVASLPRGTEEIQYVPKIVDWRAKTSRIAFSSELLGALCKPFQ